jgi:hypothetical protein
VDIMTTTKRTLQLLITAIALAAPQPSGAQKVADVMTGIRDGGGWIGVPIEAGHGTFSTVTLPTAGMTLKGCVTVWYGHSGRWEIEARERIADDVLRIAAEPGIGVPFSHEFGMRAQIDFDFRWSEARDTTLMLWVGLDLMGRDDGEACEPRYAGEG